MKSQAGLPDYLKKACNGAPLPRQTVICGKTRFTVITPSLIRIEQGCFTDLATETVLCRDFCPCDVHLCQISKDQLQIETETLLIRCDASLPLEQGLTIRRKEKPYFLWHFGEKPLRNLGGTASTLDEVNGACELEDGLCSLDGFALLEDGKTPLLDGEGWFCPRTEETDVYFFGYGHDYTACIQDYYRLTGAPGMLPAFALGNWWSRYHAYTDQEYLALMDAFRAHDIPLSVGIVDMDWHLTKEDGRTYTEGWTGYTWNERLFPDYRGFIKELHKRGLRTALNLHPALGVRSFEKQYQEMCIAMGRDPKEGKPVRFNCLDPNFLKAYFEVLHFPYEEDGVDFWWMDWQSGSDYRSIAGEDYLNNGLDAIPPLRMLNRMHYLASERKGERGMIFSRYSGYGSQRYPIGFSGDSYITWKSLDFQPYFTATAANVGYGWWSHDIGGHMGGYRDDELAVRWIQLGVFSPIFRLHSTDSPFLGREPWNYNRRAEEIISDLMRLRHRLFPYLYTMNRRASRDLLPLVRPMYHLYPESTQAYEVPNEYAFGSELIVSPITEKADSSELGHTRVWLPEGVWTDMMTGYLYHGGILTDVYRPLEKMPVFMKAGAIVPLQVLQPHDNTLGGAEHMEVLIAPGASNTFTLYEDDGRVRDPMDGDLCETCFSLEWWNDQAIFTAAPAQGKQDLLPIRTWTLRFRGFHQGCTVYHNERPVPADYDEKTRTVSFTLEKIRPESGFQVSICRNGGLIHDNSDWRERIIDALMRAQTPLSQKEMLLKKADEAMRIRKNGEALADCRFAVHEAPSLAKYMKELISQV